MELSILELPEESIDTEGLKHFFLFGLNVGVQPSRGIH